MNSRLALPTLSLLLASCVAVHYESPSITVEPGLDQEVAILPFTMVMSGKQPAGVTPMQIEKIEEFESLAFQTSLYYALLDRSSGTRKNRIHIDFQSVEQTNRILAESGISIRASWGMDPTALADRLGVDAVVRTRVHKVRYLSAPASYGIDLGTELLRQAAGDEYGWLIPYGMSKTHDISADASLLDGRSGDLMWKVAVHREADWTRPANEVIARVTRKLAKKFPYQS